MWLDRFVKRLLAVCALALAVPVTANAATFTVNTTADDSSAPSASLSSCPATCTLRDALIAASNSGSPSVIDLPAGTYRVTLPKSGTDDATTGDLGSAGGAVQVIGASARTTVIDATGLGDRVLQLSGTGSLTLSHLTITGGSVADNKGGGGIFDDGTGTLTLSDVAVVGNVASQSGSGGGVYNARSAATVNIDHSLIANNQNSGDGGGLDTHGTVAITNSTISNNHVDTALYPSNTSWGAYGGAMEVDSGTVSLTNVTIAGNTIHGTNHGPNPSSGGGAGTAVDVATPQVTGTNVIIYGNTASGTAVAGDCDSASPQISHGHNVDQDGSCFTAGTGDTTADPKLGSLANNGGETDTMAIGSSGSAYNAGSNGACTSTDQRGVVRPVGSACDIGAFELDPPVNTAAPAISGSAVNLQVVSCSKGTWGGSPFQSYSYEWKRDGAAISGASSTTYTVTSADVGHQLTCTVTASTPGDGSLSATSAAVTPTFPSNAFSLGKLTLNKHKGTATQTVKIPGRGKLVLKGKGVKTARKKGSGGNVKLKIAPTTKQLRTLKANGTLKIKISVTYTPTGGKARTKHKKITLVFKP